MKKLYVLALGVIFSTSGAYAEPGFDCRKATTPTEHVICSDDGLGVLDKEINEVYKKCLASVPDTEALRVEQRKWLKEERSDYKTDVGHLKEVYTQRIAELKAKLK
ncbi:MAG TPA: lysozyme inhibitor LprI family protein [Alphaproteobacteria bacterium]|nr:lysozyme inhibitor LprI family protein [Alphaproteobacteria bacterium]HQS93384.1 lysozyme inhibitor LprI family protein [Alphaproteobacteria bacterium]